mgnify:CR=1 FL=1
MSLSKVLKEEMLKSLRTKIGAMLVKPALKAFKGRLDYEQHGGAPLLGISAAVIKAHGSSNAMALMNAIRQARQMVEGDVAGLIAQGVANLTIASE